MSINKQPLQLTQQLKIGCKRINVLIGEPNTGKSNILESLGIFSAGAYSINNQTRDFVRYERTSNLFYDETDAATLNWKFQCFSVTTSTKMIKGDGKPNISNRFENSFS